MSEQSGEYKISQQPVVNPPSEAAMKLAHELMMAPDLGAAARRLEEWWKAHLVDAVNDAMFLTRIRDCLKKWAARYAQSDHARKSVKETNLLVQEIDERLLKL